jgi:hypothetical protein
MADLVSYGNADRDIEQVSLSSSLCVKLEKCFLFLFGGRVLFFRKKKKKKFLALLQFFLFFGGERERERERERGRILVQVEYSVKPVVY